MKKILFLLAGLLLVAASNAQNGRLTLRDITNYVYYPEGVRSGEPMADGESYARIVDGQRIVRTSFKTGKDIGVLFDVNTARGDVKLKRIDGYILSPDEKRILIRTQTKAIYRRSYTAVYYIFDVANNRLTPLSKGGPQQVPIFSPDGNLIAFAREGNLFLVKLLFGNSESQITKDGERGKILNGIPDWVYEEEFSTNCSFDFSADSKMLAWVRYDESKVPMWKIQEYKGAYPERKENAEYPGEYAYKYPVAGAKNSDVCVMSFDIKSRAVRKLDVPVPEDGYIPRIKFTSDPNRLAVITLNRHQSQMDIQMVNPRSGVARLALRETNDKYIRDAAYVGLTFFDGHFALLSERSGYQHLYWYTLDGNLVQQVTKGNFEVSAFYGRDAQGRFYYASHEESPLRTAVYVTDSKGRTKKLSKEAGTNSALFSAGMKYYLNTYSSAEQPPVYTLHKADGTLLTTLVDNSELKQRVAPLLGQREFFTFTTSQGVQLNGLMVKPRDFDASKRYPVIMYQYSGPGSQEVKDSWMLGFYTGSLFESYMADQGYIYVIVDGRGTGARGAEFEKCTYLQLGLKESIDQVETAKYLGTLPYVDKANIGIWGWSFGGFNTLMSMTDGTPVFKAGVAIAAPTDWKYYDTVYTERYMRTPAENVSGYGVNPITRAANLHGELLIMHGSSDDNVHLRNAMEMSEALVQADKQFEMQVYTNRNHNISGGNTRYHIMTRLVNFFNRNLK